MKAAYATTPRKRRRDAKIQDQQAHPAIQECDSRPEEFSNVYVRPREGEGHARPVLRSTAHR